MIEDDLPQDVIRSVGEHLGSAVELVRQCDGDGWTATARAILSLRDGRTCFVKHALTETTASWLRTEATNYRLITSPYVAEVVTFIDGDRPSLVLEDLSDAAWPPPWPAHDLASAHDALDQIARTATTDRLPALPERLEMRGGWRCAATDHLAELLSPATDPIQVANHLADLADTFDASGHATVLLDARTGNVCITDSGVKWIDLDGLYAGNLALAHALLDISASTGSESPPPGDAGAIAHVSGLWAEQLGAPSPNWAPELRHRELPLLRNALRLLLGPDAVRLATPPNGSGTK